MDETFLKFIIILNSKLILKYINQLYQAENISYISKKTVEELNSYKRFGSIWARANIPVKEIYLKSIKNSKLQF